MTHKNLLKGFKKPQSISFEHIETNPRYGKFTAYPFEHGFGTTIGNTLRRILLSSIQGCAVTGVRITTIDEAGSPHVISSEFEAIAGVAEDTIEVLNTLKQIRFALPDDVEEDSFVFEWTGKTTVKAGDFEREGRLKVLSDKDVEVFSLAEDATVEFEFQVDVGRGYVPSEVNEEYIDIAGTIAMDAIFTPITRVKYAIEPCRVGQRNDYDKLVMEIWTDGTWRPEDALACAARIAKEYFSVFVNFSDEEIQSDLDGESDDVHLRQLLDTPVEALELSVRSSNCLKNANIRTIGEVTKKTEDDLSKTRNFGKKSLLEIKEKLQEWGLELGMKDYSHVKAAWDVSDDEEDDKEIDDES